MQKYQVIILLSFALLLDIDKARASFASRFLNGCSPEVTLVEPPTCVAVSCEGQEGVSPSQYELMELYIENVTHGKCKHYIKLIQCE